MRYNAGGNYGQIIRNKAFLLILTSQGISSLGDAFQLVAATMQLVKMTGSGLAAGFTLICTPLASLFLSPFAGVLGDKFSAKYMLVIIDILRGVIVVLFMMNCSVTVIYVLILLISSLDILYSPARNKVIISVIDNKDLVAANSLQSGVYGTAYVFGPIAAGTVIGIWGGNIAFAANSLSFFISALLIMFIKFKRSDVIYHSRSPIHGIFVDIRDSLHHCLRSPRIVELLEIGFVIGFGAASINITFYSFVFDTLGITSKGWSIMLSTLYGTNLIAMLVSMIYGDKAKKPSIRSIYRLMFAVSVIWFLYSLLKDLRFIILLQIAEGTSLSLISILSGSYLLIEAKKSFAARVSASNDFLNNAGKLISITLTYMLLQIFEDRLLFAISSSILFAFSVYKLVVLPIRKKLS